MKGDAGAMVYKLVGGVLTGQGEVEGGVWMDGWMEVGGWNLGVKCGC